MIWLVLRRIVFAAPTLLAIIALAFTLMHAAPGGPFDRERQLPQEIENRLKAEYKLDRPVHEQFVSYVTGLAQGDLGPSMTYKDKTVADILAEGFPTSATIGLLAMALAFVVGGAMGVGAALRQNRAQDYAVMGAAILGVCLPPLVMGPLLQLLFGVQFGWLPTSGLYRDELHGAYLILPVLTLSAAPIAIISRLMRASMIETLRSNAIRTARAKGLPEWRVVLRHALPTALQPVVSYLGPALASVMAGSFIIETVFQLPGIGRQFITGALSRDYTLVMGVVLVYASLIIVLNLAADVAYRILDPRARTP